MKYIENDFSNKLEGDKEITQDKDGGENQIHPFAQFV